MERTIIIKPNTKTVSVLKKMLDLKDKHRKEILTRETKK